MTVDPMPAGRGLLPLADVADRERSDGGPELVIGRKDAWLVSSRQAMPMLPRPRDEIGEPRGRSRAAVRMQARRASEGIRTAAPTKPQQS
jgi:hypothetical protein